MEFLKGISYNWRGLRMALRTPRLLTMGLIRFAIMLVATIGALTLLMAYHDQLMTMVWARPQSMWLVWLWYLVSWLIAVVLGVIAAVLAYVLAQLFFSIVIMDMMSSTTEKMVTGAIAHATETSLLRYFFFLIKQELPRAMLPLLATLLIMIAGWLTPLGPIVTVILSAIAAIFLAWDHTDLVPARRRLPLNDRLRLLRTHLSFHLGFGLWFLIPVANMIFLSFAPVGATLFALEILPPESD